MNYTPVHCLVLFRLFTFVQFLMRLYRCLQWIRFWLQIVTDGKSICQIRNIFHLEVNFLFMPAYTCISVNGHCCVNWKFKYFLHHYYDTVQGASQSSEENYHPDESADSIIWMASIVQARNACNKFYNRYLKWKPARHKYKNRHWTRFVHLP